MEDLLCVLNSEDPNIPGLQDEDDAPPELVPENVVNPAKGALQHQPQEIAVPIPDPLLQDAVGEFLIPFPSLPFAPRGIGKLEVFRAPVTMNIDPPPVLDDAAPPVLDDVAPPVLDDTAPPVLDDPAPPVIDDPAPPVIDAALNVEPPLLPTAGPSNVASLNVVEPSVLPSLVDAGASNAAAGFNDVVEPPSGTPNFLRSLYKFLMGGIVDPNLASVMTWVDNNSFQILNRRALVPLYPLYFGSDNSAKFYTECQRHGIVKVGNDVWTHPGGYLCRGRPELLQAIQPAMKEECQAAEQNLEIPPRNDDSSS